MAMQRFAGTSRGVVGAVLLVAGAATGWARTAPPMERIALESLDYQALPDPVLRSGAALMAIDYVDGTHLLVTFARRRLMARVQGAPATDQDRNIDGVLVELPSGKVLARTSWRVHDMGRYLWALGDGRFVVRERNELLLFAPMDGLKRGEAFARTTFLTSRRPITAIQVSPATDLLVVETVSHLPEAEERRPSPGTSGYAAAVAAQDQDEKVPEDGRVQIDFFRVPEHLNANGELHPVRAGTVFSRGSGFLPVDTAGWLSPVDQGQSHWAFDFHRHDGKVEELSPFDSTCRPLPILVSRSEFVAFGCHGGTDRRQLGGFNFRGEEMWEQSFGESFASPELAYAPAGGRFAMSRMLVPSTMPAGMESAGSATAQAVTVYQTESGRQVFSMTPQPVLRASQNFALSPDGTQLAVVNNGAVEVYGLPAASAKERAAMELARTMVPPAGEGEIRMGAKPVAVAMRQPEEEAAPVKVAAPVGKTVGLVRHAEKAGDEAAAAAETSPGLKRRPGSGGEVGAGKADAPADGAASSSTGAEGAAVPASRPVEQHVTVLGDPVVDEEHPRRAPTLLNEGEKADSADASGKGR